MNERRAEIQRIMTKLAKWGLLFLPFVTFLSCFFLLSTWTTRSDRSGECSKGYERGGASCLVGIYPGHSGAACYAWLDDY